jgi:hypothetical protein
MASSSNADLVFFAVERFRISQEDGHSLDLRYLGRQPNGWWMLVEDPKEVPSCSSTLE